jgi:hypothetical protein
MRVPFTSLIPALPTAAAGLVSELPFVDGLFALPSIATNIERIAVAVEDLPEMRRDIARMAEATETLPAILQELQHVRQSTAVMPAIEEHVRDIEHLLPVLVELERSLPMLVAAVEPLKGPAERLARISDRFPGRSRRRDGA